MRKTNKLISFILALAMLVSLVPTAVFAASEPVAKIGDTEYYDIDDALLNYLKDGGTLELLADVTSRFGQFSKKNITIKMNEHCITASTFYFSNNLSRTFENGTAVGTFRISGSSSPDITLTAPADADIALKGGINFTGDGGSIKISGAKVGLKGTLKTNTEFDISGTVKAVELTAKPNITGYTVLGSTDPAIVPASEAVYDSELQTYTVNGEIAKRIMSKALPEPDAPILTKDGAPVSTTDSTPITICVGQSITFDITYTGDAELTTYIQKGATNFDISAIIAADKKTFTVTTTKALTPGVYRVVIYPKNYDSKSATVYIKVIPQCNHRNDDNTYSIDENHICTTCKTQMVASVEKLGTIDYYENFTDAINNTSTSGKPEDCKLTLLTSVKLTDYLSIYGRTFTYVEAKDAKLEFANTSHFMSIEDGNGNPDNNPSNIIIDSIDNSDPCNVYIKDISLCDNSKLTTKNNTTIGKLSIASINASFYLGGKVSTLSANIPYPDDSKNLIEYLDEDTFFYNYETNTWISRLNAYRDKLENVTMKTRPFKNFSVNSYSSSLYYPGTNYVTFNYNANTSPFDYTKVKITAENLPSADNFVIERTDNNVLYCAIKNLPAGTYTIPFTMEYDGYTEKQTVTFTVNPCPIAESSNITVKINDKTDDLVFPYTRGGQMFNVQVLDRGEDVTDSFTIEGNTITKVGKYDITITAKDNTNYSGVITRQITIDPIMPEENVDYVVNMPKNLKYDGNPKEVKIVELAGSGISSENENLEIDYRVGDASSTITAPTEPGTYNAFMWIKKPIGNYGVAMKDLPQFTITKADSEFEFTGLKDTYQYEESAKIKGKIKKAGENAASPSGTVEIFEVDDSGDTAIYFPLGKATLDENGEFEFNSNDLTTYLVAGTYKFKIEYSGDSRYNGKTESKTVTITKTQISLDVSNTEQRYAPATERKITVTPQGTSKLTEDYFIVRYYLVDENSNKISSVNPVGKTISAGRYLYVISFNTYKDNKIARKYELNGDMLELNLDNTLTSTDIPNISDYANIGFMDIKAASEISQKPISFKKGSVTLKQSSDFAEVNTLVNENTSTVTYESSDTSVAEVDADGRVKAVKSGKATITATSVMTDATPVYASYTITVRKELSASDFEIIVSEKTYNGDKSANATAVVKEDSLSDSGDIVTAQVSASFDSADAGENKSVNYEITGISGRDADKYVLSDVSENLKGTVKGTIEKAPVSVICAKVTTRTFDGTAQTADVSAMANGRTFDGFAVKYNGFDNAMAVGEYTITIVLNADAENNYYVSPFDAVLKIVNAAQDVFSIENVPETVYYGDQFTVAADGADGTVAYTISGNATIDDGGKVNVTGTGKITITATSKKDGYDDKTAARSFNANKRILTPAAAATDREYNGAESVSVSVTLENLMDGDSVTASGNGTMINADAGDDKLVYVTDITLSGDKAELYTLSSNNAQTSVNISKAKINSFTISASDKKYDGSVNANASIVLVDGLVSGDEAQVTVIGDAVFNDKNSAEDKTVTFTATGLSGAKSGNYEFADENAKISTSAADIIPVNVKFTIGTAAFAYDGTDKTVQISAVDENNAVFDGYTVAYLQGEDEVTPNKAGEYTVKITLDDAVNYVNASGNAETEMTISTANQEQISVVGMPGTIAYGDTFELEAIGGSGEGAFKWSSNNTNITITLDEDDSAKAEITVNGAVGEKVEITVKKEADANFEEKTTKTVFIPTKKNVSFIVSDLEQVYDGDGKGVLISCDDKNADYTVKYNGSETKPTESGTYTVTVSANGNYAGGATAMLVISKARLTGLAVSQQGAVYGAELPDAVTDNAPSGTAVNVRYSTADGKKPTNAGKYTVTATYSGKNYETFETSTDFEITKKELTVKAKDATRSYGEANPVFTLLYYGFIEGESSDNLLSEPIATVSANASSSAGEYPITVSGGRSDNYSFKYDNGGKLTVTGAVGGTFYITGANNNVLVGDEFNLRAYYGNALPKVEWSSSNADTATVDGNGHVTVKQSGTVTITARINDTNYQTATAEFTLKAEKKTVVLTAIDTVKSYNGQPQDIGLISDTEDFVPIVSGEGKNVDIFYTLTTDASVTEAKNVGVYTVRYTISDTNAKFKGSGTATLYINKSKVTVKAKDIQKVYGGEPNFELEIVSGAEIADINDFVNIAEFASDGADKKASVNTYDISLTLKSDGDQNRIFEVAKENGKLTVTKAPLTVKVKDVIREYGAENPTLEAEFEGFVNDETKDVLTGELVLNYADTINAETAVGTYTGITTASGLRSDNYEITYEKGNVEVTKIKVAASAGAAKGSYLIIGLDKALPGLSAANFTVKNGADETTLTGVTESNDGKTYTLSGSFTIGTEYTVEIKLESATHEITGSPLTLVPTRSSSGGSGGGGGGSSVSSYTVKFETNGGSTVENQTVKKNETVSKPTEPKKDGFEFAGWFTDKELKNKYDFDTKVTKNFTLYAAWTEAKTEPDPNPTDKPENPEKENPFDDVSKDDWYYDDVKSAVEKGLFNGTGSKTFAPNDSITRGMFVTVLYRAEGEPKVNTAIPFVDVSADSYYANAVIWAEQNGIVTGVSETEFAPNENITREQIAAIMFRYAKYKGYDVSAGENTNILSYTDAEDISEYAAEAMQYAVGSGLMKGKTETTLNPKDNATRAEIAAILQRFIEANK